MKRVPFRTASEQAAAAPGIAEHLRDCGLIAYPTETVYGFGCALRPAALARLAHWKGRDVSRPFLLLANDAAQAPGLRWPAPARTLAAAFWPGPLTLVLAAEPGVYPEHVTGASGGVALRVTPHAGVRAVIDALGEVVTSTSANVPGEPPATAADEVERVLREMGAEREFVLLDGGRLPPSEPSTIVDCTGDVPRILREGAVHLNAVRRVLKEIDV